MKKLRDSAIDELEDDFDEARERLDDVYDKMIDLHEFINADIYNYLYHSYTKVDEKLHQKINGLNMEIQNKISEMKMLVNALELGNTYDSKKLTRDSEQTDVINEIKEVYPEAKFVNVVYKHIERNNTPYTVFRGEILNIGVSRFDLTKKDKYERLVQHILEKHGFETVMVGTNTLYKDEPFISFKAYLYN